jgi:CheY-specific phosphatase CheX
MPKVPQTSIAKSISTTNNQPNGKVDIKNNNGIKNSVSAIIGQERSEAILEAIFNFDITHAVEFAQRDLNDYMRWWDKMAQRNWAAHIDIQQSYQNSAITASFVTAGITGLGNAIAGLAQKNTKELIAQSENQELKFGQQVAESQVFS